MKPGRELDALIAEKVMGCKPVSAKYTNTGEHSEWLCECKKERHAYYYSGCDGYSYVLHKYSTDIKLAWLVVEKLKTMGFNGIFYFRNDNKMAMRFTKEDAINDRELWTNKTAPHAICLAALKAVGHNA